MAAANTDNFIKTRRNFSTQIGTGGVADSVVATVPLATTTNLPADTAVIVTINRIDANGVITNNSETVLGVVSGTNLINCVRGVEGTAQPWGAGKVVELLWHETNVNRMVSGIVVEHNQDGTHKKVTGMDNNTAVTQKDFAGTARALALLDSNNLLNLGVGGTTAIRDFYLVDTGAANAYVLTCVPALLAYTTGLRVRMKIANASTGASTLNINGLGVKSIKKQDGATALASGDFKAGQVVELVYDGTNFQLLSPIGQDVSVSSDGWIAASGWSYASANTINVPSGAAAIYTKGDRIKFTQTTVKYGVITAIADTLLTIAVNTDYVVANAAITSPYYSHQASPLGYPHSFILSSKTKLSIIGKQAIITGWEFLPGNSTSNMSKALTFPSNIFGSAPDILTALLGGKNSAGDPTSLADFVTNWSVPMNVLANSPAAGGCTLILVIPATLNSNQYTGISWQATGDLP